MKNILPLCFLLLAVLSGQSQSVLGSVGGEGQAGGMQVSYTAGEAFVTTLANDSTVLTQGFHQPPLVVTAIAEGFLPGTVLAFPNPTPGLLNVRLTDVPLEHITITLCDQAGRQMLTAQAAADLWQTDLTHWAGGYYLLRVTDTQTNQSNSFKIFKSN